MKTYFVFFFSLSIPTAATKTTNNLRSSPSRNLSAPPGIAELCAEENPVVPDEVCDKFASGTLPVHDSCDQFDGKAQGMCIAYCHAKDCPSAEFEGDKGCDKVKAKFVAETGQERLPCEKEACPCWPTKPVIEAGDFTKYVSASSNPLIGYEDYWFRTNSDTVMRAFVEGGISSCEYYKDYDPRTTSRSQVITTPEQHATCVEDVQQYTAENYEANPATSVAPVCRPMDPPADSSVVCPCWNSIEDLSIPEAVGALIENYFNWNNVAGQPGITLGYYYTSTTSCNNPDVGNLLVSPDEAIVCYNIMLEFARSQGSENACHDLYE